VELFHYYKNYGVRYKSISGTTTVEYLGEPVTMFHGMGEIKGKEEAHSFIDRLPAVCEKGSYANRY
jgi:hypothetical protein